MNESWESMNVVKQQKNTNINHVLIFVIYVRHKDMYKVCT